MTQKQRDQRWKKAMDWWTNSPLSQTIRDVACNRMIRRGCEEIGSSDMNYAVYSLWESWESYQKAVKGTKEEQGLILFLVDYANDLI